MLSFESVVLMSKSEVFTDLNFAAAMTDCSLTKMNMELIQKWCVDDGESQEPQQ